MAAAIQYRTTSNVLEAQAHPEPLGSLRLSIGTITGTITPWQNSSAHFRQGRYDEAHMHVERAKLYTINNCAFWVVQWGYRFRGWIPAQDCRSCFGIGDAGLQRRSQGYVRYRPLSETRGYYYKASVA